MGKLTELLQSGKILISDGALGTALYQKGMQPGECPELWSVERAEDVYDITKRYIDAGSELVTTNSFCASRFKLEHYGLQDRVEEINRAAVQVARWAAGNNLVLGSIGPTGKLLLMGDVTEQELYDTYLEQAAALSGADAIIVETMTDAQEAAIAVRAAKEATGGLDVICTFTFDRNPSGEYRTMMGISPQQAGQAALSAGADVIGTNCGNGVENMAEIIRVLHGAFPETWIMVQSNAGLPQNIDGVDIYPETPAYMASFVPVLVQNGARIIGGCCGTTPAHIQAMRQAVDGLA